MVYNSSMRGIYSITNDVYRQCVNCNQKYIFSYAEFAQHWREFSVRAFDFIAPNICQGCADKISYAQRKAETKEASNVSGGRLQPSMA